MQLINDEAEEMNEQYWAPVDRIDENRLRRLAQRSGEKESQVETEEVHPSEVPHEARRKRKTGNFVNNCRRC